MIGLLKNAKTASQHTVNKILLYQLQNIITTLQSLSLLIVAHFIDCCTYNITQVFDRIWI